MNRARTSTVYRKHDGEDGEDPVVRGLIEERSDLEKRGGNLLLAVLTLSDDTTNVCRSLCRSSWAALIVRHRRSALSLLPTDRGVDRGDAFSVFVNSAEYEKRLLTIRGRHVYSGIE